MSEGSYTSWSIVESGEYLFLSVNQSLLGSYGPIIGIQESRSSNGLKVHYIIIG